MRVGGQTLARVAALINSQKLVRVELRSPLPEKFHHVTCLLRLNLYTWYDLVVLQGVSTYFWISFKLTILSKIAQLTYNFKNTHNYTISTPRENKNLQRWRIICVRYREILIKICIQKNIFTKQRVKQIRWVKISFSAWGRIAGIWKLMHDRE